MSTSLMKKISGRLVNQQGLALEQLSFGITVELMTSINGASPGGWIGSSPVKVADATFEIFTAYALGTSETVYYRILNGNELVATGSVQANTFSVTISVTPDQYKLLTQNDITGYTFIKGAVTIGGESLPAAPLNTEAIKVKVNTVHFRTPVELGQSKIDALGNYEIKIANKSLQPSGNTGSTCDTETLIPVTVSVYSGSNVLGTSGQIQPEKCCTIVDLHIEDAGTYVQFKAELDQLLSTLDVAGVTQAELQQIAADTDSARMFSLATTIKLSEQKLRVLADALKTAAETTIVLNHTYVLCSIYGSFPNVWALLDNIVLTDKITKAADARVIADAGDISRTATILRDKQIDLVSAELNEDGRSVAEMVEAVAASTEEARRFILICTANNFRDVRALWSAVEGVYGLDGRKRLQQGMQVIGLTGMQPEMAKALTNIAAEQPLRQIAVNWGEQEWQNLVTNVCDTHNKLCVPLSIRGTETSPNNIPVKKAYAARLKELSQDIFATAVMAKKITDRSFPTSLITDPVKTAQFLNDRPDYDLRQENIWNFKFSESPYPTAVRTDLLPVQNLLRAVGGKPEAITAMLKDGIKSSADIVNIAEEDFVAKYATELKVMSAQVAQATYGKAAHTNLMLSHLKAIIQPNYSGTGVLMEATWADWMVNPGPSTNPDLQTLFGSMDLCSCSECMSMYSPAAYFTDILNLVKHKMGNPPKAYNELFRRREDLIHIDLTCKNSNTAIPYIDLVNEMLEMVVLRSIGVVLPFQSYQTSGTAAELAAYPEHTYKDSSNDYQSYSGYEVVYNTTLKKAVYSNRLPFDLPLEEGRTYLGHLGYKRYDAMYQFRPADYVAAAGNPGINEYNALAEWLNLSRNEADIITKTPNADIPADAYAFYDFTSTAATSWYTTLCNGETGQGLKTLLKKSAITYKELLQLVHTDFLNKKNAGGQRPLEINSTNAANTASCQLKELQLKVNYGSPEDIFKKWYRFLRLQKATGWSIYQLDLVLISLGVTALDIDDFKRVAKVHQMTRQLNVMPEQLCAFWSKISVTNYINYNSDNQDDLPSVYDNLFRNKSLVNPPETAFDNPEAISGTYKDRAGTIVAAFNIKEEELFQLLGFLGIDVNASTPPPPAPISLAALSRVLGIARLAQGVAMPVKDMIRLFKLAELDGPAMLTASGTSLLSLLEATLDKVRACNGLAFGLDEIEYLLAHKDAQKIYIPSDDAIKLFYESLRTEVKKLIGNVSTIMPGSDLEKTLKNTVIQFFSAQFNTDGATALYLISEMIKINGGILPLIDAMIRPDFINALQPTAGDPFNPMPILEGGSVPSFTFAQLYSAFKQLHKITFIVNRYKLVKDELAFFHSNAGSIDVLNISALPIVTGQPTLTRLLTLFRLNDWIQVKGQLNLRADEFLLLMQKSLGVSKDEWLNQVLALTGWQRQDVEFLAGNTTGTGILNVTYSATVAINDFRKAALMLQLLGIMDMVKRIGLTPAIVHKTLRIDAVMADSRNIRKAAKAKHGEEEWLKIAKPLQDTLREKQRQALVAYIVNRPDIITNNGMKWKNENELFAYLLMDVEMQACMKTSRIKQGINSLQLYMDRIILNLENANGSLTSHITISPAMTEQWKEWRKWYRIWEANRKIFLYPENWIEPELRDDKTPFFKELETQLLQDEVKDNTAEDAFMAYLEMVEEVGRMEPVSLYHQLETDYSQNVTLDKTHVFSKTSSLPHRFYYRCLEDNEWTPWEKVNVDIKSDHVVPVVWNRKLYLFWLTFQKKKVTDDEASNAKKNNRFTSNKEWTEMMVDTKNMFIIDNVNDAYSQWEIKLNWSQYKDGKWMASELTKDTMIIDLSKIVMSNAAQASLGNVAAAKQAISWLNNRGEIKADEFVKNRLYLYQTIDGMYPNESNQQDTAINFSLMFTHGLDETATGICSFLWRGDNSQDPFVPRSTYERGYQLMAPASTRINKMKFVEDPYGDGKLYRDNINYVFSLANNPPNTYFSFDTDTIKTFPSIVRGSKSLILNSTVNNGGYKVTARSSTNGNPHSHYHNPMLSEFMFEDIKNTYFVRWERTKPQYTVVEGLFATEVSYGKAFEFASKSYPFEIKATNGQPDYAFLTPSLSSAFQTYGYKFHTFYHAQIKSFIKTLNKDGISGLLRIENQKQGDTMGFGPYYSGNYQPTELVHSEFPRNNVQFEFTDAYSIYNWEIFFHAPMMIAQRLSDNQQFDEAQKWYHYIFNPTSNTNINSVYTGGIERFWKFYPFYKESQQTIQTLNDLLMAINANNPQAVAQVDKWEKNPFKPHVIARMRILAYMKNVLMKYIDNLVAWGDQLFRRDTIESINEATQLYILAANLLGERPQEIPSRGFPKPKTFNQLDANGFDALSNSLVNIEAFFAPNTGTPTGIVNGAPIYGKMFYFCLPKNDKLMGYWDTVADRLFKIRNCMNIEGSVRQLPLFEPPIDPALLVRAAALGVDTGSIVDAAAGSNLPQYRFSYMLQKANEFCSDVRGLGSSLLSALEKKDAEQLSLLRSGQELQLLEKVKFIKESQVEDAEAALDAMRLTKENTQQRFQYYSTRPFMNSGEQKQMQSLQTGMVMQTIQGSLQTTASALSIFPQIHLQSPFSLGPSFGGEQLVAALNAVSNGIGIAASINASKGNMAGILGGYERRNDDWVFQTDTAAKELEQLDKQIISAEIRLAIAKKELANHELQMEHSAENDAFMRSKFTNKELYTWMTNQIAATYFQSYQLAYDLARKAEECYKHELPIAKRPVGGFVKFGYWDSLRKGLMSGEKLQFDLRKMEATYMEENKREFELTKNFSLAMIDPQALLRLRNTGNCDFNLDQIWYDLDFPGHYLRKIKSVSISIPCIAGPYTTIASELILNTNAIQKVPGSTTLDTVNVATKAIATSTAQNDAGVFELNFRDERYIPFENAGAISSWTLKMMDDTKLRQFDYGMISDIIIQVRYTARGDDSKASATKTALNAQLSTASTGINLPRYFSLKHEFSSEWYKAFTTLVPVLGLGAIGRAVNLKLQHEQFPYYSKGKTITISGADFVLKPKAGTTYKLLYNGNSYDLNDTLNDYIPLSLAFTAAENTKDFNFILYKMNGSSAASVSEDELEDLFCVLRYKLG